MPLCMQCLSSESSESCAYSVNGGGNLSSEAGKVVFFLGFERQERIYSGNLTGESAPYQQVIYFGKGFFFL